METTVFPFLNFCVRLIKCLCKIRTKVGLWIGSQYLRRVIKVSLERRWEKKKEKFSCHSTENLLFYFSENRVSPVIFVIYMEHLVCELILRDLEKKICLSSSERRHFY